jgi:hypothetical protein
MGSRVSNAGPHLVTIFYGTWDKLALLPESVSP